MLLKRVLAALVLAAIGLPAIYFGGLFYFSLITIILCMAAWEYVKIFRAVDFAPSCWITVGGVFLILVGRVFLPEGISPALMFLVLAAMTFHMGAYERGRDGSATDFAITLGGLLYLGWLGAYLVDLRFLNDGIWYFFLVLIPVWIADSAAYFIGKRFGKHPLAARLSPKKTWEGYWAGVFFGTLTGLGLSYLFRAMNGPEVSWLQGSLLGLVLSLLTTLGDLGESMIKRQAGVKDSSSLIPGHGGFLDRIDSWLWAGAIGYYSVVWFIL